MTCVYLSQTNVAVSFRPSCDEYGSDGQTHTLVAILPEESVNGHAAERNMVIMVEDTELESSIDDHSRFYAEENRVENLTQATTCASEASRCPST